MPDGWEVENNLNPLVDDSTEDPDEDGLINVEEYKYGTDPNNWDSDSDGLADSDEIDIYFTDPTDEDSDSDGLNDYEEVFVYLTDPLNNDTDGDGSSDWEEVIEGTDPNDPDDNPTDIITTPTSLIISVCYITIIFLAFLFRKKLHKGRKENKG
jgi:hypothetical protein